VAAVPWARHGAGHTTIFDDRIAWRTVGAIITRVWADVERYTTGSPACPGSGWQAQSVVATPLLM